MVISEQKLAVTFQPAMALITASTEWAMGKSERNGTNEQ
jgi:hypothetical protein